MPIILIATLPFIGKGIGVISTANIIRVTAGSLEDLAEHLFRKNAKEVKELKELNKVVVDVYGVIDKAKIDFRRK